MHERNAMKNSKFSLRNFFEEIILARAAQFLDFSIRYSSIGHSSREIYLFLKKLKNSKLHFRSELFEFFSIDLSSTEIILSELVSVYREV